MKKIHPDIDVPGKYRSHVTFEASLCSMNRVPNALKSLLPSLCQTVNLPSPAFSTVKGEARCLSPIAWQPSAFSPNCLQVLPTMRFTQPASPGTICVYQPLCPPQASSIFLFILIPSASTSQLPLLL
jgi:hypothetical protein